MNNWKVLTRAGLVKAGETCRKNRPFVRPLESDCLTDVLYSVQRAGGKMATVALGYAGRDGREKAASCDCPHGQSLKYSSLCYHVTAALIWHCALLSIGKPVAVLAPPAQPDFNSQMSAPGPAQTAAAPASSDAGFCAEFSAQLVQPEQIAAMDAVMPEHIRARAQALRLSHRDAARVAAQKKAKIYRNKCLACGCGITRHEELCSSCEAEMQREAAANRAAIFPNEKPLTEATVLAQIAEMKQQIETAANAEMDAAPLINRGSGRKPTIFHGIKL